MHSCQYDKELIEKNLSEFNLDTNQNQSKFVFENLFVLLWSISSYISDLSVRIEGQLHYTIYNIRTVNMHIAYAIIKIITLYVKFICIM